MPLIQPGKYDVSYNQDYLLTKLQKLDIYSSIFWGFWVSVILSIAAFVAICAVFFAVRRARVHEREQRENALKYKEEQMIKKEKASIHDLCSQFHEICRLIYEDKQIFGRPQKMIEDMYYPELKELVHELSKQEKLLRKNYKHLAPDYLHYRQLFIEREKNEQQ